MESKEQEAPLLPEEEKETPEKVYSVPKESKPKKSGGKKTASAEVIKQREAEGFYDAEMYELAVDGSGQNTGEFGKKLSDIKNMHISNIDEYNTQQWNTHRFIKRKGAQFEVVDVQVPGRLQPRKLIQYKAKK